MVKTYPDVIIYNPDSEDFTVTYDLEGTNRPRPYTIHAGEYEKFPSPVADHIKNHLANKIVRDRGIKTNYDDEYKNVVKEIEYE